jgi:glycosyltransferase involved in cell wall biosynthesis
MIPGKVNIVIPMYNQEEYIRQCLESALSQTYKNFDVTLVNDGSTDHSGVVVQEMIDRWNVEERPKFATATDGAWVFQGKLKVIERENRGLSTSRNEGIRAGDGEFILPLDSDDWIDPTFLEKTVPKMLDQTVGIVSTDMQYEGLLHNRIPPRGLTLEQEMESNNLPVCSLIRRVAFEQTPGYETIFVEVAGSTRVLGYEDWNLWIDILKRGWKVAVVNEPLFHYRVKPVSMITQAAKKHAGLVRLIHLLHHDLWRQQ